MTVYTVTQLQNAIIIPSIVFVAQKPNTVMLIANAIVDNVLFCFRHNGHCEGDARDYQG